MMIVTMPPGGRGGICIIIIAIDQYICLTQIHKHTHYISIILIHIIYNRDGVISICNSNK